MLPSQSPAIFTVSRLNQTVRLLLEREMGQVWISGEISNFSQPSSGHWYFTLKDDNAQVRCAMFRNSNRRVTFRPQHGQQVLVRANITLYEPRGDYQIIVESMQPAGEGLLQQKYEQLKAQLTAEGLFDQKHKQALPPAHCVGVITSKTGAALHDILHVLRRRDPSLPVIIYPTAVQGDDAPGQIVRAIALANARQECDVLIVGAAAVRWKICGALTMSGWRGLFLPARSLSSAPSAMKPTSPSPILLPTCGRRPLQPPRRSSAAISRSCCASCSPDSSGWRWRWTISSPVASAVLPSCSIACSNSIRSCVGPPADRAGTPAPADAHRVERS
jgi:hypothetical protein